MTYEEEKEATKAIAQKIADAMGWEFKPDPENWQVEIIHEGDKP